MHFNVGCGQLELDNEYINFGLIGIFYYLPIMDCCMGSLVTVCCFSVGNEPTAI